MENYGVHDAKRVKMLDVATPKVVMDDVVGSQERVAMGDANLCLNSEATVQLSSRVSAFQIIQPKGSVRDFFITSFRQATT